MSTHRTVMQLGSKRKITDLSKDSQWSRLVTGHSRKKVDCLPHETNVDHVV